MIINIDYPLGMAAYHHLSRLGQGVGDIRGIYVTGKAATLNARVGDVMISTVAHDEHSRNTYLFRNCFTTSDVQPFMRLGNVLDNQKALTVRGAFLQNRDYMSVFYREGFTVLEMEAGPYLSAAYEITEPKRHPIDEIVSLVDHHVADARARRHPLRVGCAVLAAPEPVVEVAVVLRHGRARTAAAIAIAQRILTSELARLGVTRDEADVVVHRRRRVGPRVRELSGAARVIR